MTAPSPHEQPAKSSAVRWALATTCVWVFFARVWLIEIWGSALPYWDQWDGEALQLYHPWVTGTLKLSDLFAAHNEHRIVLTRIADLALLVITGTWSPWFQMLLNAALHAAAAVGVAQAFVRALPDRTAQAGWLALVPVIFALTAGWQNALWGFQSQVLFANVLAIVAITSLCGKPLRSSHCLLGFVALALAPISNAGGAIAWPATLCAAAIAARIPSPPDTRRWWPLGLLALGTVIVMAVQVEVPAHAVLRARSPDEFLAVVSRCLAWPAIDHPAAAVVMMAPLPIWIALGWRRKTLEQADAAAVGFAVWTLLQACAVAYSRGAGLVDHLPLSRYHDPLLPGVAAHGYGAMRLAVAVGRRGRLLLLAWLGVLAIGGLQLTTINLSEHLPYKRARDHAGTEAVRLYLHHGDTSSWGNIPLPHPNQHTLKRVLDDSDLRAILPPELRDETPPPAPLLIRYGAEGAAISMILLIGSLIWLRQPDRTQTGRTDR